ncbi:hypothetical protein KO481_16915 [Nocardia sp. NEAU-G5]|uniref:Uncharacterized protein n=1 Tax=Nocardia albiluteola TaxID=2842303 RepID=A0ABS6AZA2_9NOCA|nr:hypothetical protein [Nocardia albiluteola]MBU3063203.1 hypothetical protein [Nocardia albiluteola]
MVDITDLAQRHRLAVGRAWIENAIPPDIYARVFAAAVAAMVPVGISEIRHLTIQTMTLSAGVITPARFSLILRHNNHGILTATILA